MRDGPMRSFGGQGGAKHWISEVMIGDGQVLGMAHIQFSRFVYRDAQSTIETRTG